MNEAWKKIIKTHIESFEAIDTLLLGAVIDDEHANELRLKLLCEIIGDFRSEVDD